jgi:sterol desaturase/sphingolipid hydroxylase (fatty acid hydroxylase superfamily)
MHPKGTIAFVSALVILIFSADILAYWIHRGMHIPWIFNNIHYQHHELVSPVAYGTLDAHPIEVATWDFLPIILPVHIWGTSDLLTIVFSCIIFANSMFAHSGYYKLNDGLHDLHHERRKCNYGTALSDTIFGTFVEREPGKEYPRFDKKVKDLKESRNIWLKSKDAVK